MVPQWFDQPSNHWQVKREQRTWATMQSTRIIPKQKEHQYIMIRTRVRPIRRKTQKPNARGSTVLEVDPTSFRATLDARC